MRREWLPLSLFVCSSFFPCYEIRRFDDFPCYADLIYLFVCVCAWVLAHAANALFFIAFNEVFIGNKRQGESDSQTISVLFATSVWTSYFYGFLAHCQFIITIALQPKPQPSLRSPVFFSHSHLGEKHKLKVFWNQICKLGTFSRRCDSFRSYLMRQMCTVD